MRSRKVAEKPSGKMHLKLRALERLIRLDKVSVEQRPRRHVPRASSGSLAAETSSNHRQSTTRVVCSVVTIFRGVVCF